MTFKNSFGYIGSEEDISNANKRNQASLPVARILFPDRRVPKSYFLDTMYLKTCRNSLIWYVTPS